MLRLLGFLLLLLAGPVAVKAEDAPVVLEPSGPWQVDYGEKRCRMGRPVGSGDSAGVFFIEQWYPSRELTWLVAAKPVATLTMRRKLHYDFPGGDTGDFYFNGATLGDLGTSVSGETSLVSKEAPKVAGLPLVDPTNAAPIDRLVMSQGKRQIVVRFGPIAEPLKVFNQCLLGLVESWGIDPATQARLAEPPKLINLPALAEYLRKEYPEGALEKNRIADFTLLAIIEADGTVSRCAVDNATLAEDFDFVQGPCATIKRAARFHPAKDVDGNPMRSYYGNTIAFR